ncbi:MAG: cbb3-type cytochrome c oxidase subunit 3 [Bdellovibrionales bacterium]|nr:cbb3-type cytochrome c oxidase subunit 3 [Bdellovibrionales bacterium]
MKQEGLAFFADVHWTIAAFLIFLSFFVLMVIWVSKKSNQSHFQQMAHLPLEEGGSNESRQ